VVVSDTGNGDEQLDVPVISHRPIRSRRSVFALPVPLSIIGRTNAKEIERLHASSSHRPYLYKQIPNRGMIGDLLLNINK
jgi:hypothetical protein